MSVYLRIICIFAGQIVKYSDMKKIFIALIAMLPLTMMAQDNTWEKAEQEETEEVKVKVNPNEKYLKGAVPEVDGKVVFSTTIAAPGKTADEVYDIVEKYLRKMTGEKNQIQSSVVNADKGTHEILATFQEWLVFKSTAIILDQTRFFYVIQANCQDGSAHITLSHIHYLYDEHRKPLRYKAEEWITDELAVNKKNTRLYPISGKFRRKTIDRKDFLFNKFAELLK